MTEDIPVIWRTILRYISRILCEAGGVCGARILQLNWIGSILARRLNVGRQAFFVAILSDQVRLLLTSMI